MVRMNFVHHVSLSLPLAVGVMAGCNNDATSTNPTPPGETQSHDDHAHPTTGPNGGSLVDLGDHEYLAELVHDASKVSIHLFEHDAKTPVPIDATELVINLMHDGQPEQFQLLAAPVASDPEGKSSRFELEDGDLASHLDEAAAKPQLSVTINGNSYTASLVHGHGGHDHDHDHDAEGHDHDHDAEADDHDHDHDHDAP